MKPGQLIKQYRVNAKVTQLELAEKMKLGTPQFISLLENGHSKFPLSRAKSLIKVLKLTDHEKEGLARAIAEEETQVILKAFSL